jgi:hypothetical protein
MKWPAEYGVVRDDTLSDAEYVRSNETAPLNRRLVPIRRFNLLMSFVLVSQALEACLFWLIVDRRWAVELLRTEYDDGMSRMTLSRVGGEAAELPRCRFVVQSVNNILLSFPCKANRISGGFNERHVGRIISKQDYKSLL